ncbi:MAG: ATP synthase F1 subunit delta [Patescibacteria group bacterium]|nr:ATP synthase F1 subunit delta [Patescibacteria group bacterium]
MKRSKKYEVRSNKFFVILNGAKRSEGSIIREARIATIKIFVDDVRASYKIDPSPPWADRDDKVIMKITAKQYATVLLESLEGKNEKQIGETLQKFADVLRANNHLSLLGGIIRFFNEAWDKKNNTVEAEIVTAREISKTAIAELEKFIKSRAGSDKVEMSETIDPSLLGGVILRYGNKSLDLSLKTKLADLKRQIVN